MKAQAHLTWNNQFRKAKDTGRTELKNRLRSSCVFVQNRGWLVGLDRL